MPRRQEYSAYQSGLPSMGKPSLPIKQLSSQLKWIIENVFFFLVFDVTNNTEMYDIACVI